ncbi:hypothetical protein [Lactococcus lactis]|uniref:Uncharacterized protein n=1 Tax=Lactococcus lactis TaxID=1358 RepID=A0A443L8Q3_9LACT|nr:hypothetical protein [Lactococcus lactis]NYZ59563.1 hypothetical protein [Lactococcus lactis]RWR45560.1 hypothetical protein EO246_10245 [Lactococcus lactis]
MKKDIKQEVIAAFEKENYLLSKSLKARMISQLSLIGIIKKLDEMSEWKESKGIAYVKPSC